MCTAEACSPCLERHLGASGRASSWRNALGLGITAVQTGAIVSLAMRASAILNLFEIDGLLALL